MSIGDSFSIGRLAISLAAGLGWLVLCALLAWPIVGLAGIALGGAMGVAAGLARREVFGRGTAIAAALLVPVMIFAGAGWMSQQRRASARESIRTDESCIDAVAQQLMQEKVAHKPGDAAPALSLEVPANVAPGGEIPAEVGAIAAARWAAMPAEEQEKIRATRMRWVAATHGESLEKYQPLPGFFAQAGTCLVGAMLAFAGANLVGLMREQVN